MIKNFCGDYIPTKLQITYFSADKSDGIIHVGGRSLFKLSRAPETGYEQKSIVRATGAPDTCIHLKIGTYYAKAVLISPSTVNNVSNVWLRIVKNVEEEPLKKRNLWNTYY